MLPARKSAVTPNVDDVRSSAEAMDARLPYPSFPAASKFSSTITGHGVKALAEIIP
jgi:hypothetical protein